MKTIVRISLLMLIVTAAFAFMPHNGIHVGDKAPKADVAMKNVTKGGDLSLEQAKMENGLLVIFSCNTCPFVIAWEDRYTQIANLCAANKIGVVLVNSNEAKREGADSMEKMKEHAKEKGYDMLNYVIDENHLVADAFGATRTPEVYLFNGNLELAYTGAIDDNHEDKSKVGDHYLLTSIKTMLDGRACDPSKTKSVGCSIKRKS